MKKTLALIALMTTLVVSLSVHATDGYLDIYANTEHDTWCVYPSTMVPYQTMNIYFFARPPLNGFRATECAMPLPDPALTITDVTYHPNMNLSFGDWDTGMSLSFDFCMTDSWVLCATINLTAFPPGLQQGCQVIELIPRYDSRFFGFATCATGYPPVEADHETDLHINCEPCPDGGRTERSWGAIKNLYEN